MPFPPSISNCSPPTILAIQRPSISSVHDAPNRKCRLYLYTNVEIGINLQDSPCLICTLERPAANIFPPTQSQYSTLVHQFKVSSSDFFSFLYASRRYQWEYDNICAPLCVFFFVSCHPVRKRTAWRRPFIYFFLSCVIGPSSSSPSFFLVYDFASFCLAGTRGIVSLRPPSRLTA